MPPFLLKATVELKKLAERLSMSPKSLTSETVEFSTVAAAPDSTCTAGPHRRHRLRELPPPSRRQAGGTSSLQIEHGYFPSSKDAPLDKLLGASTST
jgi:hypothetical protein